MCFFLKWSCDLKDELSVILCVVQFGSTDEESNVATTGYSEKATASAESKYKELVVSVENGVQTIRMNRPSKYNAITLEVKYMQYLNQKDLFSFECVMVKKQTADVVFFSGLKTRGLAECF